MSKYKFFINHITICLLFLAFGLLFAVLVIFPESEIHSNVDNFKAALIAEASK
jgi:hypothetical protein